MTLTREQILEMPAGPKMDALVAEHVFGLARKIRPAGEALTEPVTVYTDNRFYSDGSHFRRQLERDPRVKPRSYSTDIAAAWEVVERLREMFGHVVLSAGYLGYRCGEPPPCDSYDCMELGSHEWRQPRAEPTAPLAICRAALLAALNP